MTQKSQRDQNKRRTIEEEMATIAISLDKGKPNKLT